MSDTPDVSPQRGGVTRPRAWPLAVLAVALVAAPALLDRYALSVFVLIFLSAFVGQAWNIMMGFAGLLSLGHALYIGLGGYVAGALYAFFGLSPLLGIFPAMAVATAFGAIIAVLGFRFRIEGVYFALLTIAFAEATRIGFDHITATGGAGGFFLRVSGETAGQWWNLRGGPLLFYYVALGLAIAALALCAWLRHRPIGFRWLAVREDPEAARALGIDVFRVRLAAVMLSAALTSIAGIFTAFYNNNLFPAQVFDISRSIDIMLAPIIGGIGTLGGPIVGAFILVPLGEALMFGLSALGIDAPGLRPLFYGVALMVIISLSPSGVWPWLLRQFDRGARQS